MRMRVSLLRDQSIIEKLEREEVKYQAEKRAKEAAAKVFTPHQADGGEEAETNTQPADAQTSSANFSSSSPQSDTKIKHPTAVSTAPAKLRIRPLSDAKAIDRGANFISELFLFSVAGGLILFEALRAKRKEQSRRDTVKERLELLEERNRQDEERINQLEQIVWKLQGGKEEERKRFVSSPLWQESPSRRSSWTSWLPWGEAQNQSEEEKETVEEKKAKDSLMEKPKLKLEIPKENESKVHLQATSIAKKTDPLASNASKVKKE
jgi:optic atrophy 3 protein